MTCSQRSANVAPAQGRDPARRPQSFDQQVLAAACRSALDPAFAEKLLNFIIAEVIRHHETIAEEAVTSEGTSS